MRAMFWKDSIILGFFLGSGLVIFTYMAFGLGFDRAFVVPHFNLPEELIGGWIGWSLLFGWTMGITDQVRGVTDYISHRGFSKARLYWTQHGLGWGVILVTLATPWILLAVFGEGLYEPDYAGVGARWLLISTVTLPCYAVGVFLANLPLHIVWRIGLTLPMAFWIVGEQPDSIFELDMYFKSSDLAIQHIVVGFGLLIAGHLGLASDRDRDLPASAKSFLPTLVLLVGVGWSLHALQSEAIAELTQHIDRIHVSKRSDGSFTLSRAEYDFDTEKMTLWEVDSKSHKPTIINNELSRISLARRQRKQHAFSDGSRSHQDAGSGVAGYARLVSAYVSLEGKGLLHLVERDIYHGTKLYLEKPSGPFSKLTRLLDLRQRNKKPVIWAGDPSDGTAWFADFSQKDWRYVALELPENDRFEEWLKPNPGAGSRIAKEISGHEPHDNMFRLAFMKTTGGIAYVDRDTKQVARLPEEQMKQVAAMRATPTIPLLHVAEPGLLFRKSEVRSPDGEVLFTYDFSPSTPAELWRACLTAIGSAMHPPILAPKAFGNITHMQMGSSPYSPDGLDPLRDPIRYISLQALIISRLTWTGFSPWSLIAWVLLLVLAYRIRTRLIKLGATGPRLWLWPLAVIAFGPLGYILCLAMEPKRAFYPVSKTAADRKTVSISSPA